ncbi:MAG: hypothetical protein J2O44_00360 [Porphyrobacter sp.]|nr:hypothetical protein [Porphyrobacter sp.]
MRRTMALLAAAAALACAPALAKSSDPAHPDLTGYWGPSLKIDPMPADLKAKLPPNTVVLADTGPAEFPRGEYGGLIPTAKAKAHADAWKPEDEMTLARVCLPQSVIYAEQGPFPLEIEQAPGLIVIRYEYFDQVRLIHTDGRGHLPADAPHSKMGDSIGHWEGQTLVIDTDHIAASTITNNGLDHSDNIHMVERYRLSPDGKRLEASQWFSDPEMIQNNGARFIAWSKQPGKYIYPYECDPSLATEYEGVKTGN